MSDDNYYISILPKHKQHGKQKWYRKYISDVNKVEEYDIFYINGAVVSEQEWHEYELILKLAGVKDG